MLSAAQIKSLKQKNVSKDAEKTKQRFKEDFSTTSSAEKKALEELSGQRRSSFYRTNDTGSINARVVLAMALTLKISPFYYTGEVDDKQPLQEEHIQEFLQQHGYSMLDEQTQAKPKRANRKTRGQETQPQTVEEVVNGSDAGQQAEAPPAAQDNPQLEQEADQQDQAKNSGTIHIELALPDSPEMQQAIDELSKADAIMLLEALYMRGKASGNTAQLLAVVKRCLLS